MTYENADYYDARDSERLSCETPEEALTEFFEGWLDTDTGCDAEAVIRAHAPVTVRALARREIPATEPERVADWLLESLGEHFGDEGYSDPDDANDDGQLRHDAALPAMVVAVRAYYDASPVWSCEECGSREYSADECVAMMREVNPEWWTP